MLGAQASARSPQTRSPPKSRSPERSVASRSLDECQVPLSPSRSSPSRSATLPRRPQSPHSGIDAGSSVGSQGSSGFWKLRPNVAIFYDSFRVQSGVACLISANFVTNMVEKEIDPHGKEYRFEFLIIEYVYNILFTLELGINMYSHPCCVFWRCGWNIFDVVVVTIGAINMMNLPLPESFSMLRMMRAFRVFRLFKRVHSLKKIITAIAHAVPGVINAFILLTIVMCIYAILAVEFFINVGHDCHEEYATMPPSYRGRCFGEEYFGSFSKSLYSFFQVLTGESWSEAIARPVLWWHSDPWLAVGSAIFFVSFVLVTGFVLTNVVVAVLLDKMVAGGLADDEAGESEDASEAEKNQPPQEAALLQGVSGRLVCLENQVRLLTNANAEMRADLSDSNKEIREQLQAVLAAVSELGRKGVVL